MSQANSEFLVAPSILSADFARLKEEVLAVVEAGADWIHVDVMDGHFVPNLTIGAPVVKALRPITSVPLDVHLMIENPDRFLEAFAKAGSDYITVHVEACPDPLATVREIHRLGKKAGMSLRPRTSIESLWPVLGELDLVLIMTVEPGFGGQSFMLDQVDKIRQVRKKAKELRHELLIEVDGGVNAETVGHLGEADVLVAGSYVFKSDYREAIQTLKRAPKLRESND